MVDNNNKAKAFRSLREKILRIISVGVKVDEV